MKSTSILIPIAILVAGGIWIGTQQSAISELRNDSAALDRRIKIGAPAPFRSGPTRTALDHKKIDWGQVAKELLNKSGYGIFKGSLQLEEQLRELSAQELKDALVTAEEANLDKASFRRLTTRLLKLLLKADPSHILTHASSHPDVADLWIGRQNYAMVLWTKHSPSDAVAWFDSQPEDSFTPKLRKTLQHGIISTLAIVDFEQAKTRLAEIPDEKRFEFFDDYTSFGAGWGSEATSQINITGRFAELTRLLPDKRRRFIAAPLTWLGEQDRPSGIIAVQRNLKGWSDRKRGTVSLEVITDYFQKIKPTSSEIDLCIDAVLSEKFFDLTGQPEREPEVLRSWLRSELTSSLKPE